MKRVREVIVVEGKYDAIRVKSAVEAVVVETHGFGLFRDKEQLGSAAPPGGEPRGAGAHGQRRAGFVIRNYLSGVLPPSQVKHAYIPEIAGKERRKAAPSKEGLLGVEGVDNAVILEALERAGATFEEDERAGARPWLTKGDLYADGLSGGPDSAGAARRCCVSSACRRSCRPTGFLR